MNSLTLEQIAELAGVSRSTVSRVVNGHISVRPEVRQRVQQVIAETGYQPHAAARSLAGQRTQVIGLVIPRVIQSLFADPYYSLMIQGITQACNQHDYTLSLFLFHSEAEEAKLFPRVVGARLLDGVVLASAMVGDPFITQLLASPMPCVVVGRPQDEAASYVDVDNVAGGYTAVQHLLNQGRRRIATITGPLNTSAGQDRRQGYGNALRAHGLAVAEEMVQEGDFTEAGGYQAMQRLLPLAPDAVFIASDTMTFGALQALREAGLTVPDAVAIVSFDDLPMAALATPPLTTVRQPIRRLGATAVETLLAILRSGPSPPRQVIMATELVVRGSS
jgi:LacI family transcriptional regulator